LLEHNLARIHEAVAAAVPDRECIVFRERRLTWSDVTDRSRRLAGYLRSRGLGARRERDETLAGWESGQDHVGLYMYNCNEYLEAMLGAFKARAVPFNVNYRYVDEELVYLLRDSAARAIVFGSALAPTLERVLPQLLALDVLIQVEDGSGNAVLPGAVDYGDALAASAPEVPAELPGEDLYILYTGGTTGMPKGVLWRQADIYAAALGGSTEWSLEDIAERAKAGMARVLPAPPFMHGAAHWVAFNTFIGGGTIVIQDQPTRFDPDDVLSVIEREKVTSLLIVGDAFARPLADQLKAKSYNLETLRLLVTGGAPTSAPIKREILDLVPHLLIADLVGASETGGQGQNFSSAGGEVSTGTFQRNPNARVLSDDLGRVLDAGSDELGWLAQTGPVPLGYLGDEAKTKATFPVLEGVRYSVPGDRARLRSDGSIEVLGRDSVTINSGGEKIFAEEVEAAIKHHPAVWDVVVVGRPSERWGQEVVALVRLRDSAVASESDLLEECSRHVARYKLPKAILFRDEIVRSPSGKADYRWAKAQV
jgi:fatty-acyl-CoA synthase